MDNGYSDYLVFLYLTKRGAAPAIEKILSLYSKEVMDSIAQFDKKVSDSTEGRTGNAADLYIDEKFKGDKEMYAKWVEHRIKGFETKLVDANSNSIYTKIAKTKLEKFRKYGYSLQSSNTEGMPGAFSVQASKRSEYDNIPVGTDFSP